MNARNLTIAVATLLLVFSSAPGSDFLDRPEWSRRGKVIWGGNLHEPLAFYRRENRPMAGVDANALWLEDWYNRVRSPEVLEDLAATGANLIYANFAKGAGGSELFEDLEGTRRLVGHCHRVGIRVLAYIQFASKHIEEFPDAERWRAEAANGSGLTYGDRYYRTIACPLKPGYVDYLQGLIRRAVDEFGMDGVFLDNCYYDGCWCEFCQRDFSRYVRDNYKAPLTELGIESLENIRIPEVHGDEAMVTDRLHQAWLDWRVGIVSDICRELRQYTRSLNPEAVFSGNIIYPRMNNWHLRGVDVHSYISLFDIAYAEGHNFPRWENGVAVNNAPPMIMALGAGSNLLAGVWLPGTVVPESADQIALNLGESLAFGGHMPSGIWALRMQGRRFASDAGQLSAPYFQRPEIRARWKEYNRFMLDNSGIYTSSNLETSLAVYHSKESMAYDFAVAYPAFINTTQVLLQNQLTFDILFSQDLNRLSRYGTLLVCSQRCLSSGELEAFGEFVRRGGTLIVTGETGLFDRNRRERPDYGLAGLTGASMFGDTAGVRVKMTGSGKAVFFRQAVALDGVDTGSSTVRRMVPAGFAEVVDSVRAASRPEVSVSGPPSLACTLFSTESDGLALHLLNYDNEHELENIRLEFSHIPRGVNLLSPDGAEYEILSNVSGNSLVIQRLKTYSVLTLSVD